MSCDLCDVLSLSVVGRSILGIRIDGVQTVEPRKEDVISSELKSNNYLLLIDYQLAGGYLIILTHEI